MPSNKLKVAPGQKGFGTTALMNGIVTFYENCTNKYVRVDTLGGGIPLGTLGI